MEVLVTIVVVLVVVTVATIQVLTSAGFFCNLSADFVIGNIVVSVDERRSVTVEFDACALDRSDFSMYIRYRSSSPYCH